MADASKTDVYGDLSYGDETRRNGDYVGLSHDETNNTIKEGEAVRVNSSGDIVRVTSSDTDPVGVLSVLPRAGDSGGPSNPASVIQDRDATVKVGGTVKAVVESDVSAGEYLVAGNSTDGVFDNNSPDTESRFLALTDAVEDDRADGTTVNYAEVLIQ